MPRVLVGTDDRSRQHRQRKSCHAGFKTKPITQWIGERRALDACVRACVQGGSARVAGLGLR